MAEIHVHPVLRGEVHELAGMQHRRALAPVEQDPDVVLRRLLRCIQAATGERIRCVACPAARHVRAQQAVVALLGAAQQHFGAVIELRRAAHRGEVDHAEFPQANVALEVSQQARGIVILREHHQRVGIRIQKIVGQHFVQADPAAFPAFGLDQRIAKGDVDGEVHHAGHVRHVAARVRLAALPMGDDGRIDAPLLADHREARILLQHCLGPGAEERGIGVTEGVLPDAGEPGVLDPPQRVLDQVARQFWITLVEVGHRGHEPTLGERSAVRRRCMRVLNRRSAMVGGRERRAAVDPVLCWQVAHPPVPGADVVEHHIHDQADPTRLGFPGQRAIVFVGAEARIGPVQVGDRVAVIRVGRLVVLQQRRGPELGEAHARNVGQVLANPGDVAAVAAVGVGTVCRLTQAAHGVVGRIAIREAVGGDQVDRVACIEAAALRGTRFARVYAPTMGGDGLAVLDEGDADIARCCICGDLDGHEQIVGVVGALHVEQGNASAVYPGRGPGDGSAVNQ